MPRLNGDPGGTTPATAKFPLGQTVITRNALDTLPIGDVILALERHASGDWGDLYPEDLAANERALTNGGRLFSAYHTKDGTKFYVITEADRSGSTVLLPEDY